MVKCKKKHSTWLQKNKPKMIQIQNVHGQTQIEHLVFAQIVGGPNIERPFRERPNVYHLGFFAVFFEFWKLSVYRVNGLCRLIGKDYGPGFAVLFYIFSL